MVCSLWFPVNPKKGEPQRIHPYEPRTKNTNTWCSRAGPPLTTKYRNLGGPPMSSPNEQPTTSKFQQGLDTPPPQQQQPSTRLDWTARSLAFARSSELATASSVTPSRRWPMLPSAWRRRRRHSRRRRPLDSNRAELLQGFRDRPHENRGFFL